MELRGAVRTQKMISYQHFTVRLLEHADWPSIAEIFQGLHQFHHLQGLPRLRLAAFRSYLVVGLDVVEVDDFVLQYLIDQQCEYFLEVDQVAADDAARQSAHQLTVLAAFSPLLHLLLQLLLVPQSADLKIQQVDLLHPILVHR